jgi:hypothetical protein
MCCLSAARETWRSSRRSRERPEKIQIYAFNIHFEDTEYAKDRVAA